MKPRLPLVERVVQHYAQETVNLLRARNILVVRRVANVRRLARREAGRPVLLRFASWIRGHVLLEAALLWEDAAQEALQRETGDPEAYLLDGLDPAYRFTEAVYKLAEDKHMLRHMEILRRELDDLRDSCPRFADPSWKERTL